MQCGGVMWECVVVVHSAVQFEPTVILLVMSCSITRMSCSTNLYTCICTSDTNINCNKLKP